MQLHWWLFTTLIQWVEHQLTFTQITLGTVSHIPDNTYSLYTVLLTMVQRWIGERGRDGESERDRETLTQHSAAVRPCLRCRYHSNPCTKVNNNRTKSDHFHSSLVETNPCLPKCINLMQCIMWKHHSRLGVDQNKWTVTDNGPLWSNVS